MPTPILGIRNQQTLEVSVPGPGTARRMFVVTGLAEAAISASATDSRNNAVFTARVGPTLTPAQFVRAVATAGIAQISFQNPTATSAVAWSLESMEADFDEESGQTELQIELAIEARSGAACTIGLVSFSVSILATA